MMLQLCIKIYFLKFKMVFINCMFNGDPGGKRDIRSASSYGSPDFYCHYYIRVFCRSFTVSVVKMEIIVGKFSNVISILDITVTCSEQFFDWFYCSLIVKINFIVGSLLIYQVHILSIY